MRIPIQRRYITIILIVVIAGAETAINVPWMLERTDPYASMTPRQRPRIGAWCWEYYASNETSGDIVARAQKYGLNFLFMSLPTTLSDNATRDRVKDIIMNCQNHGIDVYWMNNEGFAAKFNHTACLGEINRTITFLQQENLTIPGITIDLEVDLSEDYTIREDNFDDYVLLLSKMKALMDARLGANRSMTLSAAICSCFHDPTAIANMSAIVLHKYLDFVVPMTYYCKDPWSFWKLNDPIIAHSPTTIGVGFNTYNTYDQLLRTLNYTASKYQDDPNFLGFCIFHTRDMK